jgi:hypothetical protein
MHNGKFRMDKYFGRKRGSVLIHSEFFVMHFKLVKKASLTVCILLAIFGCLIHASHCQTYLPGQVYWGADSFIEYRAGDLPVIISAPHGGYLEPANIPDRSCPNCVTVRDSWTLELAQELDSAIYQQLGGHAHIIICHLRRTKLDANREIVEAALGNPDAVQAWYDFHDFIQHAKDSVEQQYPKGFYIDLHAHGHTIQRLELGYLFTGSNLRENDAYLDARPQNTSLHDLADSLAPIVSMSELIRGSSSFGSMIEEYGYPSVPSASTPAPLSGEAYFSGGYNTARHASRDSGRISGFQVECNYDGIRDSRAHRERFARSMACAIDRYIDSFYTVPPQPIGTVGRLGDNGGGSLRDVIATSREGDTIRIPNVFPGDTFQLSQDREICLCHNLVIEGGSNPTIINANRNSRAFGMAPLKRFMLKNVHITGGNTGSIQDGGAILNEGNLRMENCRLVDNIAGDDGGGIANGDTSILTMVDCMIEDNVALDDGGGVFSEADSLNIFSSTLYQNTATDNGGGLRILSGYGYVENSTLVENQAGYRGGALSTNTSVEFFHSSIVNNQAVSLGGGLRIFDDTTFLSNTLLSGNTGSGEPELSIGASGTYVSMGYNLVGDTTGSEIITNTGDLFGNANAPQPAGIGLYGSHGGATATIPLLAGSPAIDAENSSLIVDQRGIARPSGLSADIGAYEWEFPLSIINDDLNQADNFSINIYPNPFGKELFITSDKNLADAHLSVMDAMGRTVAIWKKDLLPNSNRLKLPAKLAHGQYVLLVQCGDWQVMKRLLH